MAQVTHGVRSILSLAPVYDLFQHLVGAVAFRKRLVAEHLGTQAQQRVLDIGCGTGALLPYFPPDTAYVGFDVSEPYIAAARARFGSRATFLWAPVDAVDLSAQPPFDLVIAVGVLHHLGDAEVRAAFALGARALRDDGRMVTVDPCWTEPQHPVARMLISRDRGQNVRSASDYARLTEGTFAEAVVIERTDLLRIPYSHAVLSATGPLVRPEGARRV